MNEERPIIIEIKNLNKSFAGKPAVINLALTLRQGEVCGFLGPNGSGKTTTLRMICGLLTPDSGEGHCLGYNILTQSYEIKSQVSYMTQKFSLYDDMTVFENLDFIARTYDIKKRKQKIAQYLEMFNLTEHKNLMTGSMSGGMKQRLALAGCLIHEPKLLLLDEPTAGVDPKVRREFWDEIHKLAQQGITTLVSTHYMDEAERCTQLVYLAYGHLLTQGTAAEIIANAELNTWIVTGDNLTKLAEELKNISDVAQVAFFGSKIHVSGKNKRLLEQSIAPFMQAYNWQPVEPDLEDIFIDLVKSHQEKK